MYTHRTASHSSSSSPKIPITAILHQHQITSSTLGWEEKTSTAKKCINTSCPKLGQKAAIKWNCKPLEPAARITTAQKLSYNSAGWLAQVLGRKAKACRAVLCMLRTSCHAFLNLQLLCPYTSWACPTCH